MNNINNTSPLISLMEDELHYLDQIAKYLNHLHHTYTTGKLKNENRAWYTKVGMKNCEHERERVKKEIEALQNET